MIVTCPACHLNYRLASISRDARNGRCSHCDAEFPLRRRRAYRLMPAVVGGADLLASASGTMNDWPDTPAIEVADPRVAEAQVNPTDLPPNETPARSTANNLADLIAAAMLATAGAAAGYHLAILDGADLVTWAASGGGVGLILGWITIRWNRRKP